MFELLAETITVKTLVYSCLWLVMMLVGGAMYEQRIYAKKHNGKKMQTIEVVGQLIVMVATLGFLHGVVSILYLALSK